MQDAARNTTTELCVTRVHLWYRLLIIVSNPFARASDKRVTQLSANWLSEPSGKRCTEQLILNNRTAAGQIASSRTKAVEDRTMKGRLLSKLSFVVCAVLLVSLVPGKVQFGVPAHAKPPLATASTAGMS